MKQKTWITLVLAASVAVLSACEKKADSYPISGEQCGPEDPVQTLDASDCYTPPPVN